MSPFFLLDAFEQSEYKYVKVDCRDILYIEGQNEYLKIHLCSGVPFLTQRKVSPCERVT